MDGDTIYVTSNRLVVYRNTSFGIDARAQIDQPARYAGRFHRKGEPLPLYAADSIAAALGEHELHTDGPLAPGREVLRRISALAIAGGSRILVGDHRATLEETGLTLDQVYHPTDYSGCHQLIAFRKKHPRGRSNQHPVERRAQTAHHRCPSRACAPRHGPGRLLGGIAQPAEAGVRLHAVTSGQRQLGPDRPVVGAG